MSLQTGCSAMLPLGWRSLLRRCCFIAAGGGAPTLPPLPPLPPMLPFVTGRLAGRFSRAAGPGPAVDLCPPVALRRSCGAVSVLLGRCGCFRCWCVLLLGSAHALLAAALMGWQESSWLSGQDTLL